MQFGRPIAMFQAVKHHCANMLVARRAGDRRGVGRRPCRRDRRRPARVRRPRSPPRSPRRRPTSAPTSTCRCTAASASRGSTTRTSTCAARPRCSSLLDADAAAADVDRRSPVRGVTGARRPSTCRRRPRRSAPRSASSSRRVKDLDADRAAGDADRDRLRHAALAQAVGSRRRRRSSSSSSSRSSPRPASSARSTASPGGTSSRSSSTATRTSWTAGCRRRSPGGDLVPALQRARRRLGRRRHQDPGDPRRRRLARERSEGVDRRRPHTPGKGFATVRTNPDVPKHEGITMMVIDMHGKGVEVRPLRQITGTRIQRGVLQRRVRPRRRRRRSGRRRLDGRARDARQRERQHRWRRRRHVGARSALVGSTTPTPSGSTAAHRASVVTRRTNTRSGCSTCAAPPGRVGRRTGSRGCDHQVVLSEIGHDAAAIMHELYGLDSPFMDGAGAMSNMLVLSHRGLSIAGGTCEIKRNQIGERILGLPRDPLIK